MQSQELFPAIFDWGQFEDFKLQIKDKFKRFKSNEDNENSEATTRTARITADSTFKPKSLKNQARAIELIAKLGSDVEQPDNKRENPALTHYKALKTVTNRFSCSSRRSMEATEDRGRGGRDRIDYNATTEPFKVRLRPASSNNPSSSSLDIWRRQQKGGTPYRLSKTAKSNKNKQ